MSVGGDEVNGKGLWSGGDVDSYEASGNGGCLKRRRAAPCAIDGATLDQCLNSSVEQFGVSSNAEDVDAVIDFVFPYQQEIVLDVAFQAAFVAA